MKEENLLKRRTSPSTLLMYGSVSLVFILIYLLNLNFPLHGDDWYYTFIFGTEDKVSSLSDILISQYNHYFQWGGRSVVHTIAQALLMLNFGWICLLNALVYVSLVYIIYTIANRGNSTNPTLFFLINMGIWFFQPVFCETLLWKTGSANYLWGTLIIFLFIYRYYSYYKSKETKDSIPGLILFFVGGIIAGWTNENMGVALIFYILASLVLFYFEKIKIPRWAIAGLIGILIGCAFMLAAPGNYVRYGVFTEGSDASLIQRMMSYRVVLSSHFYNYILPLITLYLLALLFYTKYNKDDSTKKKEVFITSLLFMFSGLVAFVSMWPSPSFPPRALFGLIILMLTAIIIVYANIDFNIRILKYANITLFCLLFVLFGITYYWRYDTLHTVSDIWKERESYVEEQKALGVDSVIFNKRININQDKFGIIEFTEDPDGEFNRNYARYKGLRKVQVIDGYKP